MKKEIPLTLHLEGFRQDGQNYFIVPANMVVVKAEGTSLVMLVEKGTK